MLKPKPLKVKAVRNYSRAKYPSHQDPDPIQNPAARPYPFHLKTLACAAAVASCLPVEGERAKAKKTVEAPPALFDACRFAQIRRSFFERPQAFVSGGYGVMSGGFAAPIDMALARDTIFKAFKKERVRLSPNLTFDHGDVRFTADGYDPKKHMGFVMIEGKEAKLDWAYIPVRDRLEMRNYLANQHLHRLLYKLAARVNYVGVVPLWFEDEIPGYLAKDAETQLEFAASHPNETEASRYILRGFPSNITQYETLREGFLGKFGDTLRVEWEQSNLEVCKELLEELCNEAGPPESKLSDGLRSKIEEARKSEVFDDVFAVLEDCRAFRMAWNSRETLSPDELCEIDTFVKDGKEYIAVISRNDITFRYPNDSLSDEAMQKAIEEALKDLEDKVRGYIRWARQQGLQ
jgi:hypothetical protein